MAAIVHAAGWASGPAAASMTNAPPTPAMARADHDRSWPERLRPANACASAMPANASARGLDVYGPASGSATPASTGIARAGTASTASTASDTSIVQPKRWRARTVTPCGRRMTDAASRNRPGSPARAAAGRRPSSAAVVEQVRGQDTEHQREHGEADPGGRHGDGSGVAGDSPDDEGEPGLDQHEGGDDGHPYDREHIGAQVRRGESAAREQHIQIDRTATAEKPRRGSVSSLGLRSSAPPAPLSNWYLEGHHVGHNRNSKRLLCGRQGPLVPLVGYIGMAMGPGGCPALASVPWPVPMENPSSS